MTTQILHGDCRDLMRKMPEQSVHCCVTSPPYFGLRNYNVDGQIGLEATPDLYVSEMVDVFREVRRVLRDDGTVFLNLGDSYSNGLTVSTLKPKDLIGIPWRVAFALQADGWYLRQDIIWHKPNPMPESVTDRCTKSHEYIFLLSKSARYYYDNDAVKEPAQIGSPGRAFGAKKQVGTMRQDVGREWTDDGTRNKRSVWTVTTKPFKDAHFATFPPKLIEPCILAGCPEGGTVLDPFGGSGTTGIVSHQNGRNAILCELNEEYVDMATKRVNLTEEQLLCF